MTLKLVEKANQVLEELVENSNSKLATKSKEYEYQQKLKSIPFWCDDREIHITCPDTYQQKFCCLTHVVGLPLHPATNEPMPLTPYQVDFFNRVAAHKAPKIGQSIIDALRDSHKYHVNKGRQMGFTEIVLRVIQYYCFHDYAGFKIGIIAATNGSLAKKDLRRLVRLFANIKTGVKEWRGSVLVLWNGTVIEAFAASEEAMTGDTKYKCIFMDEAAKWRVIDDMPIFNSIIPIVNTNGADLFLVSTPKGPIKMFYDIHKEPKDYVKLQYDIWETKGNLYTEKQIWNMINNAKEDPNQEYLCKFVFGKNAVLGEVSDESRVIGEFEWDFVPPVDITNTDKTKTVIIPGSTDADEDDGYIEGDDTVWADSDADV